MYRCLNGHSIHSCQWFFNYFFSFALLFFLSFSLVLWPCIQFKHAHTHIDRCTNITLSHTFSVYEFQNESKRIDLWLFFSSLIYSQLRFPHSHTFSHTLMKMNCLQMDCVIICTSQFSHVIMPNLVRTNLEKAHTHKLNKTELK